jgi:hypothetical protein
MAWDVKAAAVRLLLLPRPPNDGVEDLVEIKRDIEGALASMPDAIVLDIHLQETAKGYRAIIFYTEPEGPSRGLGFR